MSTITLTPNGAATIETVVVTLRHPGCPDTATVTTRNGKWRAIGPQRAKYRPEPWGDFDGWIYNHGEFITDSFDEAINFACTALQNRADVLSSRVRAK